MTYMLVRNRVKDYAKWKAVFDSHSEAQKAAGLRLVKLWRDIEDPNNLFFLLELESVEKAREFVDAPLAAEGRERSGVIDGEYYYVEDSVEI